MNLHILDPGKVSARNVALFENAAPSDNMYLFMTSDWEKYASFQARLDDFKDKILYLDQINNIREELNKHTFDRIFIHYLNNDKIRFILNLGLEKSKIIWICWGGDLYEFLECKGLRRFHRYPSTLPYRIKYNLGIRRFLKPDSILQERIDFLSHIDVFASFRFEYDLLRDFYPQQTKNLQYADFFFYPVEDVIPSDLRNKWASPNGVFLANSASFANNHILLYKAIKRIDTGNRKVIVPLSYDGTVFWRAYMKRRGEALCPNRLTFLDSFIPLQEYTRLMLSTDRYIYANYIHHAWGNIQNALYIGAKVFCSKRSLLTFHMKKLGLHFEYFENLNQRTFNEDLTMAQKEENRRIIQETYSMKRCRLLCSELCNL